MNNGMNVAELSDPSAEIENFHRIRDITKHKDRKDGLSDQKENGLGSDESHEP